MRGRQLLERRSEMLKLRAQGVPLKTIIPDFADKYEVTEQALYIDWKKRSTWGPDVVELEDPSLLTELIQGLKQVIPNAWYEYKTNPNPSVKIAALKLAKETYLDIIEILQSIGVITKTPEMLEVADITEYDIDWGKLSEKQKDVLREAITIARTFRVQKRPDRIH